MKFSKDITVGIYTLGCKVNQYESEAIAERLEEYGARILPPNEICDAYVINTCTVTAESDRKARQFIRRAITKNPSAYVAVTGCFAQTSAEDVAAINGVDAIIGNSSKLTVADVLLALEERGEKNEHATICISDLNDSGFEPMSITKFNRTRAYVKIEDGCENKCAYCIIPSARGKVRSKSPDEVIREVCELTENGCREIVLTGIETASYGKDLGDVDLGDILCRIDKIPNVGRIRLGSLDPSLIKPEMAKKLASLSCLSPHFHLSLQSGSDRILALMKRKYNSAMAMRAIELLRENISGVKFTTDVIVGFPGETEADFEDTVRFVEKAGFLTVHIFPYSKRKGTIAAQMDGQIPSDVKTDRLHRLESVAHSSARKILESEIRERPIRTVLFESFDDGRAVGHTDDFLEVSVPSEAPMHAEMRRVRLLSTDGRICLGELILDGKKYF